MTVRVYRSSDTSAPSASTAVGGLIPILDAVLVNGYGSKSPLGWTKQYSGTNLATYLQGSGSAGRSLRVDDTAAWVATVRGLVSPSSISDTTSGAFFQTSFNLWPKGDASWMVVGNEKAFYLFVGRDAWGPQRYAASFFGDVNTVDAADVGRTLLIACDTFSSVLPTNSFLGVSSLGTAVGGHTWCGTERGVGSTTAGKHTVTYGGSTISPTTVSAGTRLTFSPLVLCTPPAFDVRGMLPGLYMFCHANNATLMLAPAQQISGSGYYAGKTLEVVRLVGNAPEERSILVEVSDTWSN